MASATIRDVAKKAKVGVGTVSRVINDNPGVSRATRSKVLAAIEELDYSPNLTARRLSLGKSMTIGVIVPFFTNPSVVKRLQGIVSALAGSEYDLILFDVEKTQNRDVFLRDVVRRQLVDGLLIISLTPTDKDVARFATADIPVVMVDAAHPQLSRVVVDNRAGAKTAVDYLISLGHRKIGYISDFYENPFNFSPTRDRYQGYQDALAEAGLPQRDDYYQEGGIDRVIAATLAKKLLTLPEPPTAIFCYCDTQAIGVLEAATEIGMKVPQELSVIGYDNIEAAELLHLTTISQSLFESGERGAALLLQTMADNSGEVEEIVVATQVIERATTAPPVSYQTNNRVSTHN